MKKNTLRTIACLSILALLGASIFSAAAETVQNDVDRITELGLVYSIVNNEDGEEETVRTESLTLGSVSKEYALAEIWAPSTGKVSLRKNPYPKSTVLKVCQAGVLVVVLSLNGEYTEINYKGTQGHIRSDCLRFFAPSALQAQTGILSYNGYTNGAAEINVRLEGDRTSRKIGTYKSGTPVTVLESGEVWTEIDVKGLHGFVMTKYVTLPEPATGVQVELITPEVTYAPQNTADNTADMNDEADMETETE